jgi:hypothetical protein
MRPAGSAPTAAGRRGIVGLGPLGAQLPAGAATDALLLEVARGVFPALRQLVARPPAEAATADPQVMGLALQVLGRLGELPELEREVGATLIAVAQGTQPGETALQAATVLAGLPATALGASPPPLLDALVRHKERWVRLAALDVASHPSVSRLLSAQALAQAATDADGYVRSAAAHLVSERRAGQLSTP